MNDNLVAITTNWIYYTYCLIRATGKETEMIVDYSVIGKRIQMIRKQKRLSRLHLASKVGISSGHLGNIESGSKCPSVEILIHIAFSLGVSVDELLMDLDLPRKENAEMARLLEDISPGEKRLLEQLIAAMKPVVRKLNL